MKLRILSCLFSLFIACHAHAGAWLQPEGKGLLIMQGSYYRASHFYDTDGNSQRQPRFTKYEFQPYGEYGVTNWLTLGGSAYVQRVHQSSNGNFGLADPEFFARTELWQSGSQHLSLQPLVKLRSHFRDGESPRGGSRSTDVELSLLYGRNFNLIDDRDYLDSRLGYRVRGSNRSPEWRADAALGFGVADNIQIVPTLRAVVATDLTEAATFSENGDLDATYVKAEVTGLYHLDSMQWLQGSLSRTVAGTQAGNGYGLSFGYARRF